MCKTPNPLERAFKLRAPCKDCPFRKDVPRYLHPQRYETLGLDLINGASFHCHKTVDYTQATLGEDGGRDGNVSEASLCAGAQIWLENMGMSMQAVQIAHRLLGHPIPEFKSRDSIWKTPLGFTQGTESDLPKHDQLSWIRIGRIRTMSPAGEE